MQGIQTNRLHKRLGYLAVLLGLVLAASLLAIPAAAQESGSDSERRAAAPQDAQSKPDSASIAASSQDVASAKQTALLPDSPGASAEAPPSPAPPVPADGSNHSSDRWRVVWYPAYLWMAGLQGTVGAGGLTAPVDASFTDIFHNLNIGYMTAVDARKGRVGLLFDLDYMSLSDSKTFTPPGLFSGFNADAKTLILTPEFYVRLKESDRGSADVMAGFRYWHLDNKIQFLPGILPGTTVSAGDNWATPVFGMRFRLNLDKDKKWYMPIMGDAGGPNLTWQILGGIGRDFKKRYTMFAGYRHLAVDRRDGVKIFDVAMSGPLMGVGMKFGVKEPVPPSASCSAQPTEVMAGEPVRVTATAANFPKGRTLAYSWNSTGGKVTGAENVGTVDTAGLAPGSYTVNAQVSDNKKKSAGCSASFTVKEPPRNPPHLSCSANPGTVQSGEASTISCSCSSPDGRPVSFSWSASSGSLSGSGSSAQLDTAGAPAGPITVSTSCTDDRGLSDSARTLVEVTAPPPAPQAAKMAECAFPSKGKPARVDNACKAVLDDVALRLQREADSRAVIVGQADAGEPKAGKLALQRADNSKAYLVKEKGIDASRIGTRAGSEGGKRAEMVIVPPGASY